MIVSASTDCFQDMPLQDVYEKLTDLEFTSLELVIRDGSIHLTPQQVLEDEEKAISLCRDTHRLGISGYTVEIGATGDEHYDQFAACCRLAKATKVASITVPSAELGTPFNEEVEHLRRLVDIATMESAVVSIRSQMGRLSEDPDTVVVLCDNVKGLGVTLDPSHYICQPTGSRNYDKLFKYTYNVHLRDTSKDELQVRVGQGEIDYGKLINMLRRVRYDRGLCIEMKPFEDIDHTAELRKLRLLLESLL
ncbi:MAG: sugar phosphate isomerase/epimerase [Planctomycetaceae bacterium]|nr:sugar phosphate isomerase/epimerase [Planctomycetaceae bacterium]